MTGNGPLTPLLRNHVKAFKYATGLNQFCIIFCRPSLDQTPNFSIFFLEICLLTNWVQIGFPYWKQKLRPTYFDLAIWWMIVSSNKGPLLDRDGFGQIPWTINVASSEHCQVVWQKLHGDHSQDWLHGINSLGHLRQIRINLLWIQISNVGQRTHSLVG